MILKSKKEYIDTSEGGCRRLVIFFAGWGMDYTPFEGVEKPGYDILVVYDYNNEGFDISAVEGYDEICVLAWSLGVYHAVRFIKSHPELPFTRTIAVNGTINPIDDTEGIPRRIYDLTSRLPDENALMKFYRRICGGQEGMTRLLAKLPQRDIGDLREELLAIRKRITDARYETDNKGLPSGCSCSTHIDSDVALWDEIYLSDNDLIFPFENMKRGWKDAADRVRILHGESHAIDFKQFIATSFADKPLIGKRFAAASATYGAEAAVQRDVADTLVAAARAMFDKKHHNQEILEIGSGVGVLTDIYQPYFNNCKISLWDLAPSSVEAVNGNEIAVKACDAELEIRRQPDASADIIFSSSTIQWFNSPRRFLKEVHRVLKPGGMAFISYYADGTLPQFAAVSDSYAMHYPRIEDVLLSMNDVSSEIFAKEFELKFDTPAEALAHLRATGVNSIGRDNMSVSDTRRLMKLITVDGKAVLTFNTMFLIMKKDE